MAKQIASRGIRNNNPGNIRLSAVRYRGEINPSTDKQFKQFSTLAWGYRAMFVLLHTYRTRHGLNSLRDMIERYAPPVENHTERYVNFVARHSGVDPNATLPTLCGDVMCRVVAAMSLMENGFAPVEGSVEQGWALFIEFKP